MKIVGTLYSYILTWKPDLIRQFDNSAISQFLKCRVLILQFSNSASALARNNCQIAELSNYSAATPSALLSWWCNNAANTRCAGDCNKPRTSPISSFFVLIFVRFTNS